MAEGGHGIDSSLVRNNLDRNQDEKKMEEKVVNQQSAFPELLNAYISHQSPQPDNNLLGNLAYSPLHVYSQHSETELKMHLTEGPPLTPHDSMSSIVATENQNMFKTSKSSPHNVACSASFEAAPCVSSAPVENDENLNISREQGRQDEEVSLSSSYVQCALSSSSTQELLSIAPDNSIPSSPQSAPSVLQNISTELHHTPVFPKNSNSPTKLPNPPDNFHPTPIQQHAPLAQPQASAESKSPKMLKEMPFDKQTAATLPIAMPINIQAHSAIPHNPQLNPLKAQTNLYHPQASIGAVDGTSVSAEKLSFNDKLSTPDKSSTNDLSANNNSSRPESHAPQQVFSPSTGTYNWGTHSAMSGNVMGHMNHPACLYPNMMGYPSPFVSGGPLMMNHMFPNLSNSYFSSLPLPLPIIQHPMMNISQAAPPGHAVNPLTTTMGSEEGSAAGQQRLDSRNVPSDLQGQTPPSSEENNNSNGTQLSYSINPTNSTRLVRLRKPILEWLRKKLDQDCYSNWEAIADARGMNYEDIRSHYADCRHRGHSPFMKLLDVEQFHAYTVGELLQDLKKINRKDILMDFDTVVRNNKG